MTSQSANKRRRLNRRPAAGPVTVRRPDPMVWKAALRLAGGDARRLTLLDDGSVVVR